MHVTGLKSLFLISVLQASSSLKEKQKYEPQAPRQGVSLPGTYGGALPVSSAHASLEGKTNSSHQALLQHLLLKEQLRQQKILATGNLRFTRKKVSSLCNQCTHLYTTSYIPLTPIIPCKKGAVIVAFVVPSSFKLNQLKIFYVSFI